MVIIKSNKLKNQHKSNIKTHKGKKHKNSNTRFNVSKKNQKQMIKLINKSKLKGGSGYMRESAEERMKQMAERGVGGPKVRLTGEEERRKKQNITIPYSFLMKSIRWGWIIAETRLRRF